MDSYRLFGMDFWTLLSVTVSLIGVFLAAYFWFNPRTIQGKIRYKFTNRSIYEFSLISKYRDTPVLLDVWNPSKAGVDKSDIRDPLKIAFPEGVIITSASVQRTVGGVDSQKIYIDTSNEGYAYITWDYLDQGMGFRVSIDLQSKETMIRPFEGIRSLSRELGAVSGRFKDFKLEEPLDLDDVPERFRTIVGIIIFSLFSTALCSLILYVYGIIPLRDFIDVNLVLKSAFMAISSVSVTLISILAIVGLDSFSKFILNTKSPIESESR